MQACVVMPQDTPRANRVECEATGAEVVQVAGLISDAARIVAQRAAQEGWFDLSTFKEPYRVEGKKVMGYELAEAFAWRLPEVIIYPTGGGTGLVGMAKAFDELEALGWLEDHRRPRLVAVQAAGCAPVVKAFEHGAVDCEFWEEAQTIASGLRVPKSFAGRQILRDIRRTNGAAIAVEDELILAAQSRLAQEEGVFAAPESAATLAAAEVLRQRGWLAADETVVCFNTGMGLKYI
jgi:threonine synthase